MKKKKILFLINTLRDGGAEKILVDIVNNLDINKYDIEVKLIYHRGVYLNKLNDNVKLSFITGKPDSFCAKWVSRLLPRLSSEVLHKLFIKQRYDVEVAFLEGYATKIVAGAPKATRKIAWVHCDLTKTEWITGVFPNDKGFSDCYKKIDEIVSVSKSVQDSLIQRFGNVSKMIVKYNPVDDEHIRFLSNEKIDLVASKDKTTLISIGRMTYQKNFYRLLNTVNKLVKEGYPIELWLLGDGEEKEKLIKYVNDNDLKETVIMPGFKKNPYAYMKQADLYVCSSLYEGFSTAATEALIVGLPVLTTDVSGMREMLGDSEFGMITGNTDNDFENGLRKLLDNQDMLMHYQYQAQKRSTYFELKNRLEEIEKIL